jgi:hypothetical protein
MSAHPLARVDDQRQAGLPRRGDVGAEARSCASRGAVVVKIVEAGLADRDDARMAGQRNQLVRPVTSSSSWALCGWVPTEQNTAVMRLGDRRIVGSASRASIS